MRELPSPSDNDTTRWLPAGPTSTPTMACPSSIHPHQFKAFTEQINASLEHKFVALTEKIAESSYTINASEQTSQHTELQITAINEKINALTSFEHKFVALTEKIVTLFEHKLAESSPTVKAFEQQVETTIEKISSLEHKVVALTEKMAETSSTVNTFEQKTTSEQTQWQLTALTEKINDITSFGKYKFVSLTERMDASSFALGQKVESTIGKLRDSIHAEIMSVAKTSVQTQSDVRRTLGDSTAAFNTIEHRLINTLEQMRESMSLDISDLSLGLEGKQHLLSTSMSDILLDLGLIKHHMIPPTCHSSAASSDDNEEDTHSQIVSERRALAC